MKIRLKKSFGLYSKLSLGIILFLIFLLIQKPVSAQSLQTPQPDTISIDQNNQPILTWVPNSDNTLGYVIIRWDPGTLWQTIDTVFGIGQTSYTDTQANPCARPVLYRIFAYGAGNNNNSLWSDTLKTIYLDDPQINICANHVMIRWTKYLNMPPSLGEYQILASTNGGAGPFFKIGTTIPPDTVFIHQNLAYNTKYTYMIRAVNVDGTKFSSSCKKSVTSYTPKQPDSVYLRYATVENNDHVKLEWTAGTDAPVSKFKILRSTDGLFYDTIGENQDITTYKPSTVYVDHSADFKAQSYYYQIRACDSCGVDTLASVDITRTIHLTGLPDFTGNTNQLNWNAYEDWVLGIEEYQIFRKIDGSPNPSGPLLSVPSSVTSYTDDVSSLTSLNGIFSYYIVAVENSGNNGYESFKDISTSNEIEISQETKVVVPNAFTPGRLPDDRFKPLVAFIDAAGYKLAIFNKWGQLIFNTEDPTFGWDGRYKGEFVRSDSYVYLLKYRTPGGKNIEKRGTVTVIR